MPHQRAALGRPSHLPGGLTTRLALVRRQPPFALHRTVDTRREAVTGFHPSPKSSSASLSCRALLSSRSIDRGKSRFSSGARRKYQAGNVEPRPRRCKTGRPSGNRGLRGIHMANEYTNRRQPGAVLFAAYVPQDCREAAVQPGGPAAGRPGCPPRVCWLVPQPRVSSR